VRRFKTDPQQAFLISELDTLCAIYDRRSGVTHVVADPVPQILSALCDNCFDEEALWARLARDFDLADTAETRAALSVRLDEMVAVGLVSPA
jgi:PqqD family protein of HPr-rel-A system